MSIKVCRVRCDIMILDSSKHGWDARYKEEREGWLRRPPRQILVDGAGLLPASGLALDAGAGFGVNSIFMAERGLRVIAIDFSEVALRLAVERARKRSVLVEGVVWDLSLLRLPENCFDVIGNFFVLQRETLPIYRQALKPGGLLFFETLLKDDINRACPQYYLEPGELRPLFSDFKVLHCSESVGDDGRRTEQLVVRKPAMR